MKKWKKPIVCVATTFILGSGFVAGGGLFTPVAAHATSITYTYTVTATALNVRTGPGTTYPTVGTLKKGQKPNVVGTKKSGWYPINYNGKMRYVSERYVKSCVISPAPVVKTTPSTQLTSKSAVTPVLKTASIVNTSSNIIKRVLDLTNQERAKNKIAPLTLDPNLTKMSQARTIDMSTNNYFDHNSPTYGSPFDMMEDYEIAFTTAGENIAMGQLTPEQVVNDWMSDKGHRDNILNPNFTFLGVGYDSQGNYWVQDFIGK